MGDPQLQANYEQNKYIVTVWHGAVMTITRQTHGTLLPLATAQLEARAMLPADATLIETHQETPIAANPGDPKDTVEVYRSESLIARYTADFPWWDGGPGSIGIIYYGDGHGWILGAGYASQ